jgi:hypothetical protein
MDTLDVLISAAIVGGDVVLLEQPWPVIHHKNRLSPGLRDTCDLPRLRYLASYSSPCVDTTVHGSTLKKDSCLIIILLWNCDIVYKEWILDPIGSTVGPVFWSRMNSQFVPAF